MEERHTGHKKDKEQLMAEKILKLHDSTIAQIVRLLQLGILTGTDVSDQLRTLECIVDGKSLKPNPEYMDVFEKNLKAMQEVVEND